MKNQIFNDDKCLNIQTLISHKIIFDKNTDRKKRRIEQIQKRKKYLNETDSLKAEKSTFNSTQTPTKIEDFGYNFQSYIKKNYEESNNNNINDVNNIIEVNQFSINPFLENTEKENENLINEDKEINISDIDCNINEENNDNNNSKGIINPSSKEYAKNFCSSNLKSFIQLNNNLIAKNQNKKNTFSYLLALYPDSLKIKKKNSSNYIVNETIKEENENELFTKENNNNIDKKFIKVEKNKDLKIETRNNHNKISHKKSKSGNFVKNLLINSPNKISKWVFNINKNKNKNLLTHLLSNYKTISPCSKTFYLSPFKNNSNKTSRKSSISNYKNYSNKSKLIYNINKNNINNNNKNKKINNYNNNYNFNQSKRITLSGKNQKSKLKIFTSNNYSCSTSLSQHIKNKTSFISPSFIVKNNNKSIINSNYIDEIFNKRSHNKFINKNNFRLFDLKKALKSKLNNQYYRKANGNNLFFSLSPIYSEHKKNNLTQSSFSNCNITNRSKISSAIKKFNFSPLKKKNSKNN